MWALAQWESACLWSKYERVRSPHAQPKFMIVTTITVPDGEFFFTQGVEIDYGAQGDTQKQALNNFREGILATLMHIASANMLTPGKYKTKGPASEEVLAQFKIPEAVTKTVELPDSIPFF